MKPQRIRRTLIYVTAVVLGICGAVFFVSHYVKPRLMLNVAVGGDSGDSKAFMTTLGPMLGAEHWRLRFRQVQFDDPLAAASAMEQGKIDLLIARSDLAPRSKGLTLAILRHELIGLIVPPDAQIEKFPDVARKSIAIPAGPLQKQNEDLLDLLLDYYAIARTSVTRVVMPAADIGQAVRQKRVAAAFVIGPPAVGQVAESVASIRKTMRKPPTILEIGEAAALVKKLPRLETMEAPRGAVSGNPPIPEDTVNTLGVSVRLLASANMSNSIAGDIARLVTTRKAQLAEAAPGAIQIEAPDTDDTNAILPAHPGAVTYFSGETPTLFDRFENFIYYGGLFASLLGTMMAWLLGRRRSSVAQRDEVTVHLSQMMASLREFANADAGERALLMRDLDMHSDWALGELIAGRMDIERYKVFEAVAARAKELTSRPLPRMEEARAL